jgi:CpXC protein
MSKFQTIALACPACGEPVDFEAVGSVNADRRPDLRTAILDFSFQRLPCPKCGTSFRLDPEFSYLDVGRGQWIGAFPLAKLGQWRGVEQQARATFARAYGDQAPAAAREIGKNMRPRITFGWAGVREKLVAVEHQLDDVTLELVKMAIVRGRDNSPFGKDTELRLVHVEAAYLGMAWILAVNESIVEPLRVPRSLYDEIVADAAGWDALRKELSSQFFVDMNRLLVAPR